MIQINEWLPAFVCVMYFGATIIQKPVKQNSPIVSKWTACANRNLMARNEKNSACDFFSHSWNFDAISCKKCENIAKLRQKMIPAQVYASFEEFYTSAHVLAGIILAQDFCERKNPIWTKTMRDSQIQWDFFFARLDKLSEFFFFFCKGQILYQNCMYKYYYCLFCNVL